MIHLNNLNILVTGASGFIGSRFLEKTSLTFQNLYCTTRKKSLISIKDKNITWINSSEIKEIPKIDIVLHLATSYGRLDTMSQVINADVVVPLQLFEKSINRGCKKIINIDSFFSKDIYSYEHMHEYILAKKNLRNCLKVMTKIKHIDIINATLEHVYGPNDNADKFISSTLQKIYQNEKSIDLSPGYQKRDFIYLDDVVDALILLIGYEIEPLYREIGIGTGIATNLKEFLETFKEISRSNSKLNFSSIPYRNGEIMHSVADNKFLINMGWTPKFSIPDGLGLVYESFLND